MRCLILGIVLVVLLGTAHEVAAQGGRVIKVLPHLLDREGRHTLSPSLYERDAYQAHLRENPEEQSALRFDVQWRIWEPKPVLLRIELRGVAEGNEPKRTQLELKLDEVKRGGRWSSLALSGEQFKQFGKVTAWRASLWQEGRLIDERTSFLW
jgi:hypothetical protein